MACIKKALSDKELAAVVMKTFPKKEWVNAYAVARAESSGIPSQKGDGGKSYGMFQLYKPDGYVGKLGEKWCDPVQNAIVAAKQQAKQGWNPWCVAIASMTGTGKKGCGGAGAGTAGKFLGEAKAALASVSPSQVDAIIARLGSDTSGASGGEASGGNGIVKSVTDFLAFFTCTGNWIRVGMGILGAVLLIVACVGLLLRLGATSAGLDIIAGLMGKKGKMGLAVMKKAVR